jgi:hypothetical protein
MHTPHALLLLQAPDPSSDGLTFSEIVTGIPHDGPAIFIYLLTALAVGWVIWANRKRPKDPGGAA